MISADNIFLSEYKTTRGLVPFDRITTADYEPAIMQGIDEHNREIDSIANQTTTPTFENTILGLERSGATLNRVLSVFYPMLSANADDSLMAVSQRVAPILAEHSSSMTLNEKLWQRVKYVYDHFDRSKYDHEDWMLLKKVHEAFELSGATLEGEAREQYKELTKRLSELTLKFEQNTLKENSRYEMWLTEADLTGLPESAVEAAKAAAASKDREGEYLITLKAPSYMAFMKYSDRRDLRERLYRMYNQQCTSGEFSNMEVIKTPWRKIPPRCSTCSTNFARPTCPCSATTWRNSPSLPASSRATRSPSCRGTTLTTPISARTRCIKSTTRCCAPTSRSTM